LTSTKDCEHISYAIDLAAVAKNVSGGKSIVSAGIWKQKSRNFEEILTKVLAECYDS